MIERLARLANRSARRTLVLAGVFFLIAGALGAGVADRLDPYGADDPDTESVIAGGNGVSTAVRTCVRGHGCDRYATNSARCAARSSSACSVDSSTVQARAAS